MNGAPLLLYVLLAAVIYLIYKVNRIERMLIEGRRSRPRSDGHRDDGKVIPILKERIEPGPFHEGNRRPPSSER